MRRIGRALARLLPFAAAGLAAASCGGSESGGTTAGTNDIAGTVTIVVNAPFSRAPYVAETIERGVELAIQSGAPGQKGILLAGFKRYRVRVVKVDTALSPAKALRNVRRAVADGALAIVDEGTGIDASWRVALEKSVPIGIVYQGGIELVDEDARRNVFRIAPTDRGVAFRLAEYLVPKKLKVALLTDDTGYGQQGAKALAKAFSLNPEAVATKIVIPSGQTDLGPQVLRAKRAGATALLVWARGSTIANALSAARSRGWKVPVYTPPAGADPVVRQQLADHPEWVDGLTFASGRMTAEVGGGPFTVFQQTYESAFGVDFVGVETKAGARVTQPPEYAMYPYDFVRVLAAAVQFAGGIDDRKKILAALEEVTIQGANGDERGFNRRNHEGVIDDDVYFARFDDMTYAPVTDDPLSSTLPPIDQTG